MKKIVLFAAGFLLTLGCNWPDGGDSNSPSVPFSPEAPRPTTSAATAAEQKCFEDDVVEIRRHIAQHNEWIRPESCQRLNEDRFWEIHRLAMLKVQANG